MFTNLEPRMLAVFAECWHLLPLLKSQAYLTGVGLAELGRKHGSYNPTTGMLSVNASLFAGDHPQMLPTFDINGDSPARTTPLCSRALHTCLHELFHAIGAGTGLDSTREWHTLSGWAEASDDPVGTGRYYESRPGWEMGPSEWRYATGGIFFPREYSSRSPFEDFADCCTHIALGWHTRFSDAPSPYRANALAKLAYLRRAVWGEKGTRVVQAAAQRWRASRHSLDATSSPLSAEDEALADVIAAHDAQQKRLVLAWLASQVGAFFDPETETQSLAMVIGPLLLRAYRHAWAAQSPSEPVVTHVQLHAILRAATAYTETTARLLDALLRTVPPDVPVTQRIEQVYTQAQTVRAQRMAQTERHRMTQAAQEALWQASGTITHKVWRTQSATPCGFCAHLHGTRIALGDAFALRGTRLSDGAGHAYAVDYADVLSPPLHPSCACILADG